MPTTQGNRKILDLKRWEFCTPSPVASAVGACFASSWHYRQQQLGVFSNTLAYIYNPNEDGFLQIPSPALAGTFGAGVCACSSAWSTGAAVGAASIAATGGTLSQLQTGLNLQRDLRGYAVHILSGPNAGLTLPITSNGTGANSPINVPAQAVAFNATNTFRLLTPRFYVLGAGTLAAGSFRVYDFATNTWQSLSITGLPASWGTDGRLVATPSMELSQYVTFATGTATSGGATALNDTSKAWAVNQWTNFQVRITGGTGAGQIRTITANTAQGLTVGTAWATNPDGTSTYAIEGNDDFLYLMGNNAVTLYRYQISTNTWTTLAPGAARAGAPGAGMGGHWISRASDPAWTAESAIINGRRIYSFRGAGGALIDYYDIAANTWVSGIPYASATETFGAGTSYAQVAEQIYLQKDATGRWFRFNPVTSELDPWNTMTYTQGAAAVGDRAWSAVYQDGATQIPFVYMLANTSNAVLRQMVF